MTGLMNEARKLINQKKEEEKAKTQDSDQLRQKTVEKITDQFYIHIYKMIVLQEILFSWHKEVYDYLPDSLQTLFKNVVGGPGICCWVGGGKEYEDLLMQKTEQDDHGGEPVVNSKAWAIYINDIFGKELYLLPYQKTENGFACRIIKEAKSENKFFPHDIDHDYAVKWLAEYLEKQK